MPRSPAAFASSTGFRELPTAATASRDTCIRVADAIRAVAVAAAVTIAAPMTAAVTIAAAANVAIPGSGRVAEDQSDLPVLGREARLNCAAHDRPLALS